MPSTPSLEQTALNNALWCDSVLRAQGRAGAFAPTLWHSPGPVPPYYPRAVTLAPLLDRAAQRRLADLQPGEAVKDSFASLPLSGFDLLFTASWYWHPAQAGTADAATVQDAVGLAAWVDAWGGGAGVFAPGLLADSSVTLLCWPAEGAIQAGCALNAGADVVGLSNLFGQDAAALAAIIQAAIGAAAGTPLLAYEAIGAESTALLAAGFHPLAPLRVLVRR